MESFNLNNQAKYLTLIQAAQKLSVSVDVLLQWNDYNILKPTITQRGQIVYAQEQVDKFLEAQQLLLNNTIKNESPEASRPKEALVYEQNFTAMHSLPPTRKKSRINVNVLTILGRNKLIPIGFALTMSILLFAFTSGNHAQISKQKTLSQNTETAAQKQNDVSDITTAQTDKSVFSESTPLSAQVKIDKTTNTNTADSNKENRSVNLAYSKLGQGQILGVSNDSNTLMQSPKIDTIGYSEIAKFSGSEDTSNNLFDDAGNIKGDAPNPDVLGIATGLGKIIHFDNTTVPSQNSEYIFMLMVVIVVSTIFILKKLPVYSYRANNGVIHQVSGSKGNKVFEINQKTDGTVVLYFKGNEFKLSKPELDSESDQFIERLMEVSDSDQEIDYDKSTDENIKLSTPLSKLVTRLGFVGTKRDLFFPRTSKNKVLFRKYITEEDLTSMNLNATELFKEFTTNKTS